MTKPSSTHRLATIILCLGLVCVGLIVTPRPVEAQTALGNHVGPYMWQQQPQSSTRYFWIYARTYDETSKSALKEFVAGFQSLWYSNQSFPYPIVYDDPANNGACYKGSAGHHPSNSMVLACNGEVGGLGAGSGRHRPQRPQRR